MALPRERPAGAALRCTDGAPLCCAVSERASLRAALVFSPGDGSYDQPYFYVTPWPYPSTDALPLLPAGVHWHTEGWTGAVLTAEQVISRPADRQRVLVLDALGSAITACRTLLRR